MSKAVVDVGDCGCLERVCITAKRFPLAGQSSRA